MYQFQQRLSGYDIAQLCLNGHIINSSCLSFPESNQNYCHLCGAKSIHTCPSCNEGIRGAHMEAMSLQIDVPAYCHNCGVAYPWTEARLAAARELLEMEMNSLAENEKEELSDGLDDLVADTPRTQVAVVKWKRFLAKAGEHTALAFKEIIIEIASETAKRAMFP